MSKIKAGYLYTEVDNLTIDIFESIDIAYYAFLLTDGYMNKTNLNPEDKFIRRLVNIIQPMANQTNTKVVISLNSGYGLLTHIRTFDEDELDYLIDKLVDLIDLYNFDGYDLAIEGYVKSFVPNFIYLVKNLYTKLKAKDKLLTATFRAGSGGLPFFDDKELHNYLDYINVMTYAMDSGISSYPSSLHKVIGKTKKGCSWEEALQLYKGYAPLNKLMFGFATYILDSGVKGQSYLDSVDPNDIVFDNETKTSYYTTENGNINFESPESLDYKLDFIENENLAGIFFWESGWDDGRLLNVLKERDWK